MYLFFDTETTGMPRNWKAPVSDTNNWPRMVQIAWLYYDEDRNLVDAQDHIIQPEGYTIPKNVERVHGISTAIAKAKGVDLEKTLLTFKALIDKTDYVIAHNISFDEKVVGAEFIRKKIKNRLSRSERICTMQAGTNFCRIPGKYGYKWPTLSELHIKTFGRDFSDQHNARADTLACANCFFEMVDAGAVIV